MRTVFASNEIIDIAGTCDTSGKLNMWANIIKWIILVFSAILILVGIGMMTSVYTRAAGLVVIILGVIQGFLSFFYVYMLRAFAILTEAASIIVLEHQAAEESVE